MARDEPGWKRTSGLSLLETMMAVAIVALLTATAIQGMRVHRERWRLETATRELQATLVRAKWNAMTTGRARTIDVRSGPVVYVRDRTEDGTVVSTLQLGAGSLSAAASPSACFTIDPRGLLPAGSTTITVSNRFGDRRVLRVGPAGKIEEI